MKKKFFALLTILILANLFSFAFIPSTVQAQVDEDIREQLEPIEEVYSPDEDVDETTFAKGIAKIIQVILGFLAVIFLVLIIYAGFMWMTAAGNDEKITKAKNTMVAATIGTAIILCAYAITYFVVDQLLIATGIEDSGI